MLSYVERELEYGTEADLAPRQMSPPCVPLRRTAALRQSTRFIRCVSRLYLLLLFATRRWIPCRVRAADLERVSAAKQHLSGLHCYAQDRTSVVSAHHYCSCLRYEEGVHKVRYVLERSTLGFAREGSSYAAARIVPEALLARVAADSALICCTSARRQCVIYDSDRPDARLIGIEYVVSEDVSPDLLYEFAHSVLTLCGLLRAGR